MYAVTCHCDCVISWQKPTVTQYPCTAVSLKHTVAANCLARPHKVVIDKLETPNNELKYFKNKK